MARLPIPLPFVPSSVDPSIRSGTDVQRNLPRALTSGDHPVLDDATETLAAMLMEHQLDSAYAAGQADVLRAEREYLSGLADDRAMPRGLDEADPTLRARLTGWVDVVTPAAILAAVNDILEPYTDGEAQLIEELDGWFVGTSSAHDWISPVGDGTVIVAPTYPDRMYADDAADHGGYFRQQSEPLGSTVFTGLCGRFFVLLVPEISDESLPAVFAADGSTFNVPAWFVADGTTEGLSYMTHALADSLAVYQAIANAVETIRGAGVRWQLLSDPRL